MLVRRYSDPLKTSRSGRHGKVTYCISKQEVRLDSWEDDDCAECIGRLFGIEPIGVLGWTLTGVASPFHYTDETQLLRVLEDDETGYIYYRRPVDVERQLKWNHDRSFRVTADEW